MWSIDHICFYLPVIYLLLVLFLWLQVLTELLGVITLRMKGVDLNWADLFTPVGKGGGLRSRFEQYVRGILATGWAVSKSSVRDDSNECERVLEFRMVQQIK
jgi:hypothetical protein